MFYLLRTRKEIDRYGGSMFYNGNFVVVLKKSICVLLFITLFTNLLGNFEKDMYSKESKFDSNVPSVYEIESRISYFIHKTTFTAFQSNQRGYIII